MPVNKPVYALVGGQPGLTPFPDNDRTRKIIIRTDLEREADRFAKQGLYEQALLKYQQALDPSLLNYDYDKGVALGSIRDIHERQGKYELALKEQQWFIDGYNKSPFANDKSGRYMNTVVDKKLELEALIKARETHTNKPVYDHIAFLRKKYSGQLPPKDFNGYGPSVTNDIIHLYDYMKDSDGAISFLNGILDYLEKHSNGGNADKMRIADYKEAKSAFEEDKRTGQKGHLQKAIENSDHIGW